MFFYSMKKCFKNIFKQTFCFCPGKFNDYHRYSAVFEVMWTRWFSQQNFLICCKVKQDKKLCSAKIPLTLWILTDTYRGLTKYFSFTKNFNHKGRILNISKICIIPKMKYISILHFFKVKWHWKRSNITFLKISFGN